MGETAYRLPILNPDEGEPLQAFLLRAAAAYRWPGAARDQDLELLDNLLTTFADEREAARFGGILLRALSFAADSSMSLRHMDRYIRSYGEEAGEELKRLRDNVEHLHFLCSLFSFSQYLSEVVIAHREFLRWIFQKSRLNREKPLERYREQLAEWMDGIEEVEERRAALTLYKKRELLRIGVRDIREMAGTRELCRELSNMAQAIIELAYEDCRARMVADYGRPLSDAYHDVTGFCVYAMGKFGAGELNFSSDVDLVFVYDEEGSTEGVPDVGGRRRRVVTNHEFFNKLARILCQYLNDPNEEGFLFRIDARLRPEGDQGPLSRSRSAYAAYLNTQAAVWEKIAYLKARCIAGDEDLASIFDQIIELFVYGNNRAEEVIPEIARLKRRIDYERLDADGRELDIKRGRGGIREIEFIVSMVQILEGLRNPRIRLKGTLEAMERLVEAGALDADVARQLEAAYLLYRRIEHTLQMMQETQTHRMPSEVREREALALRCGFLDPLEFEHTLSTYRQFVRNQFDRTFHTDEREELTLLDYVFSENQPPGDVLAQLKPAGLGGPDGFHALRKLATGTAEFAPSAQGRREFRKLLPILLEELPHVALPKQAVHHFDLMLRAAKGYTWIYDMCLSNPPSLKLLLRTLGFGSLLARQLIAHPEWLDEIFYGDGLYESRTERAIAELPIRLKNVSQERALATVRQFKQLECFLVSVQEVLAVTTSRNAARRTAEIAEAVLDALFGLVAKSLFGEEAFDGRWSMIGLGGIGDRQVHASGDLDVAIVVEDGTFQGKPLSIHIDKIGQRVISLMGAVTPEGQLWKVDARLRPEGAAGPLAATKERFLQYYSEEAGIWEWQALTKARPVAGDRSFGREVLCALYDLYARRGAPENLAAEIRAMRARMESNLRLPRTALFDFKTGRGGIVDVEFLVQYLQLSHPGEAAELFPLTTEEALGHFIRHGKIEKERGEFLQHHLALLRLIQRHHRLLWETTKDQYPAAEDRQEALRRGMNDQLMLQEMRLPVSLPSEMARAREIFDEFFSEREEHERGEDVPD